MSELAKAVGRRLFGKAAMGVPLALKGTIQVANSASMYPPPSPMATDALDMAQASLREKVFRRIRIDMQPQEEMNGIRWQRRQALGGLDPDLAVLNSMSVTRRIQIQIDRDREENARARSFRSRIIRMMGGNPEDYE